MIWDRLVPGIHHSNVLAHHQVEKEKEGSRLELALLMLHRDYEYEPSEQMSGALRRWARRLSGEGDVRVKILPPIPWDDRILLILWGKGELIARACPIHCDRMQTSNPPHGLALCAGSSHLPFLAWLYLTLLSHHHQTHSVRAPHTTTSPVVDRKRMTVSSQPSA